MIYTDLNARIYEAVVDHRLEHVHKYVWNLRRGGAPSAVMALWNVRALQDESRQAGYKDLAELCRWLERAIAALDTQQEADCDKLAAQVISLSDQLKQCAHGNTCGIPAAEEDWV